MLRLSAWSALQPSRLNTFMSLLGSMFESKNASQQEQLNPPRLANAGQQHYAQTVQIGPIAAWSEPKRDD